MLKQRIQNGDIHNVMIAPSLYQGFEIDVSIQPRMRIFILLSIHSLYCCTFTKRIFLD